VSNYEGIEFDKSAVYNINRKNVKISKWEELNFVDTDTGRAWGYLPLQIVLDLVQSPAVKCLTE
jgi:hypothetical protein